MLTIKKYKNMQKRWRKNKATKMIINKMNGGTKTKVKVALLNTIWLCKTRIKLLVMDLSLDLNNGKKI